MLTFCRENGYDIPSDRLFDCRWIHRYDYRYCGENCNIFSQVWHHPNMPALLTKVLRSYKEHITTCRAGESYKAVFYCMHGDHESVAAVLGLRTMLLANYKDIKVQVRHASGFNFGWSHKCGTRCEWCYNYHDRKAWELDLIEPILDEIDLEEGD